MNRIEFLNAGGYAYSAQLTPLAHPAGSFHLHISTRWADARRPEDERMAFELTLDATALKALISTLEQGLNASVTNSNKED